MSYWTNAKTPAGRRIYAIGDIHGRADLLGAMIELIERDDARRPKASAILVFLGDYIDRGPDSKSVVDRLAGGPPRGFEWCALKGNHEEMLLTFLDDPFSSRVWLRNGGGATLLSYGVNRALIGAAAAMDPPSLERIGLYLKETMPASHLQFYRSLLPFWRSGDYFFAHAGVRPGAPLNRQAEADLLWIRDPFLEWPRDHGAVVVHGHTPVPAPEDMGNRIGIDTLAWKTGRLTALGLEGSERWFLST